MERRKFLLTSGTALLGSTSLQSVTQEPAVGLDFEITGIEDKNPEDTDSILIDFEKFNVKPMYLDESQEMDITLSVSINQGEQKTTKKASGISFTNGQTVDSETIHSQTDTNIANLITDSINASNPIDCEVTVTVKHPQIGTKSYVKTFTIDEIKIIIDDFEDGDVSEYTGETSSIKPESSKQYEGQYSLETPSDGTFHRITSSSLQRVPQRGDTFRMKIYLDTANDYLFYWCYKDSNNWYRFYLKVAADGTELQVNKNGTGSSIDSDNTTWSNYSGEWLEAKIKFRDVITLTIQDSNGNQITKLSGAEKSHYNGPISWYIKGKSYTDLLKVTDIQRSGEIDRFEKSNLNNYTQDSSASSYTVELQSNNVYEGSKSLHIKDTDSYSRVWVFSTQGLPRYPKAGDSFSYRIKVNERGRQSFGVQQESLGDGYYIRVQAQDSQFNVFKRSGGSSYSIASDQSASIPTNEWCRVRVNWHEDGKIQLNLEDSSGTTISEISGKDQEFKKGGIGFGTGTSNTDEVWYDDTKIL